MKNIESDINALKRNPNGIRFAELSKILDRWFGRPRRTEEATASTGHLGEETRG